jgi:hypothetical protein
MKCDGVRENFYRTSTLAVTRSLPSIAMSGTVNEHPEQVTRTGKRVNYPTQSDLYAENPSPPVRFFGKLACDYFDDDGNMYWDAFAHDKLAGWVKESCLHELIEHEFQAATDTVFFVRQSADAKSERQVFTLPDSGSTLRLYTKTNHSIVERMVISIGLRTSSSYSARSVRWMLVREM